MIIIGEKINATRKSIAAALTARDAEFITRIAVEQARAGADYIDLNGGDPRSGKEAENLVWLMEVVQGATDAGITIDTADGEAMKIALAKAKTKPILNSISLEQHRLDAICPLLGDNDCMVVALLVSDSATMAGSNWRVGIAASLIEKITSFGKRVDEIIIDPGFMPLSVDGNAGIDALAAIREIKARWPEVHVTGGVSNASFGLPERKYINLALIAQAIGAGMDYAIIDPCAEGMMGIIHAAEVAAGRDEYCMNYITAARENKLT